MNNIKTTTTKNTQHNPAKCCVQGLCFSCESIHRCKVKGWEDILCKRKPKVSGQRYTYIRQKALHQETRKVFI